MFERFTVTARLAVVEAQEQARRRGADRIRTEHLLLALYAVPEDPVVAVLTTCGADRATVLRLLDERPGDGPLSNAAALATLGIDLDEIRRQAELSFGPGALDRTRAAGRRRGHLPFERAAKQALELALREALRSRHRHIGTEHILLGLLRAEGAAAAVLAECGLRLDAARIIVDELVRRPRAG